MTCFMPPEIDIGRASPAADYSKPAQHPARRASPSRWSHGRQVLICCRGLYANIRQHCRSAAGRVRLRFSPKPRSRASTLWRSPYRTRAIFRPAGDCRKHAGAKEALFPTPNRHRQRAAQNIARTVCPESLPVSGSTDIAGTGLSASGCAEPPSQTAGSPGAPGQKILSSRAATLATIGSRVSGLCAPPNFLVRDGIRTRYHSHRRPGPDRRPASSTQLNEES